MASKRQVILDLETSHLHPSLGGRVIALDMLELADGRPTGKRFFSYFNPDHSISPDVEAVTGVSGADLGIAPFFFERCREVIDFLDRAELMIFGAFFDTPFIDYELKHAESDYGPLVLSHRIIDLHSAAILWDTELTLEALDASLPKWCAELGEPVPDKDDRHYGCDRSLILYRKLRSLSAEGPSL